MTKRAEALPRLMLAAALAAPLACGGGAAGDTAAPATSLWPLTAGSSWTYRITDAARPVFEKRVQVIGQSPVPGASGTAVQIRDVEPTLEEVSWQVASDDLVVRVREEDRTGGNLIRATTFTPAMVKSISAAEPVGWRHEGVFHVVERLADGTVREKDESFQWSVLAADEAVTTPAGRFEHCVKLQRVRTDKAGKKPRIYWLAPGVGKVREEGERIEELVSYDVRK